MSTPGYVQYTGVSIQIQLFSQWPSPTFIMISPRCTPDIPHCTHGIPGVLHMHYAGCIRWLSSRLPIGHVFTVDVNTRNNLITFFMSTQNNTSKIWGNPSVWETLSFLSLYVFQKVNKMICWNSSNFAKLCNCTKKVYPFPTGAKKIKLKTKSTPRIQKSASQQVDFAPESSCIPLDLTRSTGPASSTK